MSSEKNQNWLEEEEFCGWRFLIKIEEDTYLMEGNHQCSHPLWDLQNLAWQLSTTEVRTTYKLREVRGKWPGLPGLCGRYSYPWKYKILPPNRFLFISFYPFRDQSWNWQVWIWQHITETLQPLLPSDPLGKSLCSLRKNSKCTHCVHGGARKL